MMKQTALSLFRSVSRPVRVGRVSSSSSSSRSFRSFGSVAAAVNVKPSVSIAPVSTLSLSNYPNTKFTTLPNGVRVASESIQSPISSSSVGVWIDAGARYEPVSGLTNFLSRLSSSVSTTKHSASEIQAALENSGSELSTQLCREQLAYVIQTGDAHHTRDALSLISEIMLHPKVEQSDVASLRDRLQRELPVITDDVEALDDVLTERLHETAFRNTPMARPIRGTLANIQQITPQLIKEYISSQFSGSRIVVSAAGDVNHEELVNHARSLFGSLPATSTRPTKAPGYFTGSDIHVRDDDQSFAHFAVAFQSATADDPDYFTLKLIGELTGSYDLTSSVGEQSSLPLVRTVSGNNDMSRTFVESISPFYTQYSDVGLFGVRAVCQPTTVYVTAHAIMKTLVDLVFDVEAEALETAKTNFKVKVLKRACSNKAIAEDIGRQTLSLGRRIHPAEVIARIDAIDVQAIKNTARRFFYDRDVAVAAVGAIHEMPDYNWFRSKTFRIRY